MEKKDIKSIVDSVIEEEFKFFDLDPLVPDSEKNRIETPKYLLAHRHEYIRTIADVVKFAENNNVTKILEIGIFFGVVSISLRKLGFQVYGIDIPEYILMPEQQKRFGRHQIETAGVKLQDYLLPFQDDYFDAIIMCEVFEHLNFNPLPLVKEINRIGAPNSLFYLALPNLAYYKNRLKFLRGQGILQPINNYFIQLDPNEPEIVNGHWREYTGPEIIEILERMGYKIENQYYFSIVDQLENYSLRNRLTQFVFKIFPSFKEDQVTKAIKKQRTEHIFHIPDTVNEKIDIL
jgi:SAM-dependent methyltransferase